MSEKMDGIRAYWDGGKLLSRYGNELSGPGWFTAGLPITLTLDGELWMGQDTSFENINSILRSKTGDWSQIQYYVFDLPSSVGPFETRLEEMKRLKAIFPSHVHIVKHQKCEGISHLMEYLTSILTNRGEGVIVRQPQTHYIKGHTTSILKVKVSSVSRIR